MGSLRIGEGLSIGDHICLYCEETGGYVYNEKSSTTDNNLCIYTAQDRHRPKNIPNQHVVLFQVCIQNRYKLNKKYRKLLDTSKTNNGEVNIHAVPAQYKSAADAENNDNDLEQKRQHGKRVRYGEIVQLRHMFTGKFVHMITTQTSQVDKNYMKICLEHFNSKNAQFRILPRYKVKSEGEVVQFFDQLVFESIKSPGHFFHASTPYQLDYKSYGSELNLGIERSSFTVVGSYREALEQERLVRGGSVIRLFHKELEAYLVAEGLFDEKVSEDVHLRIRLMNYQKPKSLMPSTSGITYWQIEEENSILDGEALSWEQQIRLRHMVTRQYLCIESQNEVCLVNESTDPRTVFRLHSVLKERDEILYESYARIEHVITGCWLHALKDQNYEKHEFQTNNEEASMYGLRWDGAAARKVAASNESVYRDAYTIQMVSKQDILNFNFTAGMVPFIFNLIHDFQTGAHLNAKKSHAIVEAMEELKTFMKVHQQPIKDRQKLLRNLKVIDLLVRLLQCALREGDEQLHMIRIFKEAYDVLQVYMLGKSRKNALYFAKYIDFFQTQFTQKGGIGQNAAHMIVELIRDKRRIVERITTQHLDRFIGLLRKHRNYRFLDLLQVLCVCDGVSLANNQTYITEKWLRTHKESVLQIDRGQNINKQPNVVYVSTNNAQTWIPLHEFVNSESSCHNQEEYNFLIHQLELFKALAYGRNDFVIQVITREFGYLTWEDAFLCINSNQISDFIRAKFCELVIDLFVDVGNNYSVLHNPNMCFVYEDVNSKEPGSERSQFAVNDLAAIFPALRSWLAEFLDANCTMTASEIGKNNLIEQVLRLLQYLVKFGYYSDLNDIRNLLTPLHSLLDGRNDVPFPKDKGKVYTKDSQKQVTNYKKSVRFNVSRETEAIVKAKYQAMEVLELLLTFQRNTRLQTFVGKFKVLEQGALKKRIKKVMEPLLYETFNAGDTKKKNLRQQKEILKQLKDMFQLSTILNIDQMKGVLLDLSKYKYDMMVVKSLDVLIKLYSSESELFRLAMDAQILLSQDSSKIHREVQRNLPILRRLAKQKLNGQQVLQMSKILDELAEFCHLPKNPHEPNFMNQNILVSHGIADIVIEVLAQEIDPNLLKDQYSGMKEIFEKTLNLLQRLTRENDSLQLRILHHLDVLLSVQIVPSELAVTLKEVFRANQATCMKIRPDQVMKIVRLSGEHQSNASEFLDLLKVLVKVEGLDMTIKRNQALVMKYIMQDFKTVAYVLDQSRTARMQILTNQSNPENLAYYGRLIDLLAACAEGENKFIESLCQTLLPFDEIICVINHPDIDCNIKRPFIKFLMWVYMKPTGQMTESRTADLQHDRQLWSYIASVVSNIRQLLELVKNHPGIKDELQKLSPSNSISTKNSKDPSSIIHSGLQYILEGVMPFLQVFYERFFSPDKDLYPEEILNTDSLANAMLMFSDVCGQLLVSPTHMKSLVSSLTAVVTRSSTPKHQLLRALEAFTNEIIANETNSAVKKGNMRYYAAELELNAKFHAFSQNCSKVHVGHNTVQQQLKHKSKRAYTDIGGNEELPLGEEFQHLVKSFINSHERKAVKKYKLTNKLFTQLEISAKKSCTSLLTSKAQEELDIKCLQILRAIIHNEERKLPMDWQNNASSSKVKRQLAHIKDLQNAINYYDIFKKVLPHARRSDAITKEALSFLCIMLLNANRDVQTSLLDYFLSTREEDFFAAVRDRLEVSSHSIKEKRALRAQYEMRRVEYLANSASSKSSLALCRNALKTIQNYEKDRTQSWKSLRRAQEPLTDKQRKKSKRVNKSIKKQKLLPGNDGMKTYLISEDNNIGTLNDEYKPTAGEIALMDINLEEDEDDIAKQASVENDEIMADMLDYKDDGCIELVLKVLASICDGQNVTLQDYLRKQPDNLKSINIVGETAQFLNVVYSSINSRTVDLIIQLFNTLTEFCSGNQENREVVYKNKSIDYINFILRAGELADCSPEQVLELRESIATLIMALIEENGPDASVVATQVKDTIDKEAIYKCMTQCYEMHQSDKPKLDDIVKSDAGYLQSAKSLASLGGSLLGGVVKKPKKSALKESLMDTGFAFYLILARLNDIDPNLSYTLKITPEETKAFEYYKKNSTSVELVKDDFLQKVNFRIKNKRLIRDEVKEKLKWNVDRTSPSSKIRDFMEWSDAIMQDISYQRSILSNPIAIMFTKGWLLWNYFVIFLSFVITVLMMVTWNAKATLFDLKDVQDPGNDTNATTFDLDKLLRDPEPKIRVIPDHEYKITMYTLSGLHNLFSLFVLISYLISNHPRLPTCADITQICRRNRDNGDQDEEETSEYTASRLSVQFFSFATFYYLLFLAASIAGTIENYFFAFHLLNIVNNNQLLSGVIKAVTKNGISLLWVALLGLIVIYIYALIGFSLLRIYIAPSDHSYCSTLWQCTITVLHYGLLGDLAGRLQQGEGDVSFGQFWPLVLYHVSFFIFISTIGLNIIFGIIVDTFSELRDLKWRTESDMKDVCFICSRDNFDFEHHGKGFDYHVYNEHNMWSYIHFFIHLNDMDPSDYNSIELHVNKRIQEKNYDFFPVNRALCLSSVDIDSTESKIDDLLQQVTSIAQKQKEDEAEKKRKIEKRKQKRWQEKYRRSRSDNAQIADQSDMARKEGDGLYPSRPSKLLDADYRKYHSKGKGSQKLLKGGIDEGPSRTTWSKSQISLSDEDIDSDVSDNSESDPPTDIVRPSPYETSRERDDSTRRDGTDTRVSQMPSLDKQTKGIAMPEQSSKDKVGVDGVDTYKDIDKPSDTDEKSTRL